MLRVTYFAGRPEQKDTQRPGGLPWQRGAAYGPGVERQLCLETMRRLSPQMTDSFLLQGGCNLGSASF